MRLYGAGWPGFAGTRNGSGGGRVVWDANRWYDNEPNVSSRSIVENDL